MNRRQIRNIKNGGKKTEHYRRTLNISIWQSTWTITNLIEGKIRRRKTAAKLVHYGYHQREEIVRRNKYTISQSSRMSQMMAATCFPPNFRVRRNIRYTMLHCHS